MAGHSLKVRRDDFKTVSQSNRNQRTRKEAYPVRLLAKAPLGIKPSQCQGSPDMGEERGVSNVRVVPVDNPFGVVPLVNRSQQYLVVVAAASVAIVVLGRVVGK